MVEVALGADMVAYSEAAELAEKGFLTSSCCPAFVDYIHKKFPQMVEHISHNLSPMGAIGQYIKELCIRDRRRPRQRALLHQQECGFGAGLHRSDYLQNL